MALDFRDHAHARLILDSLTSTGLSVPQFSREYGVDPQRLYVWRRRLGADPKEHGVPAAPLAFVQLQPTPPMTLAHTRYELVLPGGEMLRIEGNVSAPDVTILLAALRGARPC